MYDDIYSYYHDSEGNLEKLPQSIRVVLPGILLFVDRKEKYNDKTGAFSGNIHLSPYLCCRGRTRRDGGQTQRHATADRSRLLY